MLLGVVRRWKNKEWGVLLSVLWEDWSKRVGFTCCLPLTVISKKCDTTDRCTVLRGEICRGVLRRLLPTGRGRPTGIVSSVSVLVTSVMRGGGLSVVCYTWSGRVLNLPTDHHWNYCHAGDGSCTSTRRKNLRISTSFNRYYRSFWIIFMRVSREFFLYCSKIINILSGV